MPERRSGANGGRARVTTHGELSHVALTLFLERGFDEVTVDEIASAAGIGRRTLFRYFPSKNDLPWGEFDPLLEKMRDQLRETDPDLPIVEALKRAVIAFNDYPEQEMKFHRNRMWMLFNVPSLLAHSNLRYTSWRQVIAEFVANRLEVEADSLVPQAIAWVCQGLCLSAYEQWLKHEDANLIGLLATSMDAVHETFRAAGTTGH